MNDLELKYSLEEPLLEQQEVIDEFYKYIETELARKVEQDYIINLIEEL